MSLRSAKVKAELDRDHHAGYGDAADHQAKDSRDDLYANHADVTDDETTQHE